MCSYRFSVLVQCLSASPLVGVKRRFGGGEAANRGTSPRAPACRGLTPLRPPQGIVGGYWMVSWPTVEGKKIGTLIVNRGYGWGEAEVTSEIGLL